jgi:hypothetical protein
MIQRPFWIQGFCFSKIVLEIIFSFGYYFNEF